ncbi:hypothetical protein AALA44_10905 [Enterococcus ratti]|uniref:hypothetical protein n=1 Tax=Enterococcus ratti TaxID=150033 RepID=UPI003515C51B
MPYTNKLQSYLDIFALSLSLKENNSWLLEDNKQNYSLLFSLYIKMIEKDQQEFFARSADKKQIIHSLEKSKNFYTFTCDKQLLHTLEQLNTNDPSDFVLLPLFYLIGQCTDVEHVSGILIYKENETYKAILVDKEACISKAQINVVTIPSTNLTSLCSILFSNIECPNIKEPYSVLYDILEQSASSEIIQLPYQMHPQKEGNCVVKEIEATLKVALFHCRHNLFASQNLKKIKWNERPNSTIKMHNRLLSVIKEEYQGPAAPFDLLSKFFKLRKRKNTRSYPLTLQEKKMINQKMQNKMNKYPEIQQILEGKNVYKFTNGTVNNRIDFFEKIAGAKEKSNFSRKQRQDRNKFTISKYMR